MREASWVRGSCLCGAVPYEVRIPAERFVNCDCSRRRKSYRAYLISISAVQISESKTDVAADTWAKLSRAMFQMMTSTIQMMGSGEIYLVRHGETEWNAEGRFQGALDSPLTPAGRLQALEVGRRLAVVLGDQGAAAMRVSPLGRTQATAAILAPLIRPATLVVDARLREVTLGAWDGLTPVDIDAAWPGRLDGVDRFETYFRSPNGESYEDALARAADWLGRQAGTVVAVGHGLFGRILRGAYLSLPRRETLRLPIGHDDIWRLAGGLAQTVP